MRGRYMRSDYALYVVAIICFIIAAYAATITSELYIYAIAVLGIIFIGLGYMARPKSATLAPSKPPPPPPPPQPETQQRAEPKEEPTQTQTSAPTKETAQRTTRRRRKKT